VTPEHYSELIAAGREIKWALNATGWATHAVDSRLSGVYATMIYDDLGDTAVGPHQRNLTVFADGQADRSPCGSGTSARLALLVADGRSNTAIVLLGDFLETYPFRADAWMVLSEFARNAHDDALARDARSRAFENDVHLEQRLKRQEAAKVAAP